MPSRAPASCLSPSEGSIIAYYWSEFSIPQYLVEDAERVMAQERAAVLPPRARALNSFVLTSVVAFREYGAPGVGSCRAVGGGAGRAPEQVQGREDARAGSKEAGAGTLHVGNRSVLLLLLQPLTPEQYRPPRTVSILSSSQTRGGVPPHAGIQPPPVPGREKPRLPSVGGPGRPGTPQRAQAQVQRQEGPGWLPPPPLAASAQRCPHDLSVSHADSCSFALHARSGELMRFTTPGFPDSPYPARARCQWTLRGDADFVLSLTFRSFDVATCDDRGSDLVMVYDTLSPVEPRAVVQ